MRTATDARLGVGDDGIARCRWAFNHPLLLAYHDAEWGRPAHGEQALYERLALKGFQAGLSCLIVLQKRPALRRAFGAFDPDHVATLTDDDLHVIGQDREVIRNRAKVAAARTNAEATIALRRHGGLEELVWSRRGAVGTDPDDPRQARAAGELARDLRADGFRFVGPTSAHAFLQAAGVLPAHVPGCHVAASSAVRGVTEAAWRRPGVPGGGPPDAVWIDPTSTRHQDPGPTGRHRSGTTRPAACSGAGGSATADH